MLNKVKKVETVGVKCSTTPTYPGDMLSATRFTYDQAAKDWNTWLPERGLPAKVEEIDSWSGSTPVWETTGTNTYDANGREKSATDSLNRTTSTTYVPATAGPLTSTEVTNPLGRKVTTTLATAWGQPTTVVDNANNAQTDATYDGLGRTLKVWLPGRSKSTYPTQPNTDITYLVRNNAPSAVTTKSLLPSMTIAYRTNIVLYDGLLRERQTQAQAPGGGRVLRDTVHDSRGLVAWTSNPYYDTTNPNTTLVAGSGAPAIPSLVENIYDGAGRVTNSILMNGTTEKWRTVTTYSGERVSVLPPDGGTSTATITDLRGRTAQLWQYKNRLDSGSTDPTKFDATTYTYTDRDELATVLDAAGNAWEYTYDQRGRKTTEKDPDRGITTTTYDLAGQVTSATDNRNETLAYTYDNLGRKTTVRDGSITGNKRAEWVYDTLTNGVGRLTKSIRYHPAGSTNEYVNEVTAYDQGGRPTGTKVTIPPGEGGLCAASTLTPCVYTYQSTYMPDGQLADTTLPAAAGMPSETLAFSYNDVGALGFLNGGVGTNQRYVNTSTYDKLGRLTQRILGNSGKRTWITYTHEQATGRLTNAYAFPELQPEVANFTYAQDPAGNITKITDAPAGGTTDTQCFTYDYLRQLEKAWTPESGDCGIEPSVAALGGPAPYWHSYEYDKLGNRKKETRHATVNSVFTYSYTVPALNGGPGYRPHALSSVVGSGAASGTRTYGYDAVGNVTSRPGPSGTQTLSWDSESHLTSLSDSSGSTTFLYDADGNRLIRRDPGGATLYLPGGMEVRKPASSTATATRYYSHAGAVVAIRTSAGLSFLVSDHHGTAEVSIAASTLTVSRRRTLPFGEERGLPVGTWPAEMDKGFVGGTKDNTGLTHLGARLYDPSIGRFISVDAIMDMADPLQWNGYAYANSNPTSMSDANGLLVFEDTDGGGETYRSTHKGAHVYKKKKWLERQRAKLDPDLGIAEPDPPIFSYYAASLYCEYSLVCHIDDMSKDQVLSAFGTYLCVYYSDCSLQDANRHAVGMKFLEYLSYVPVVGVPASVALAYDAYKNGDYVGAGLELLGIVPAGKGGKVGADAGKELGLFGKACGGNSFFAGTLVLMADGTARAIELVRVGDEVIATDPINGETRPRTITAEIGGGGEKQLVTVKIDIGDKLGDAAGWLVATATHPVWVKNRNRWTDAKDLRPGDLVQTPDGSPLPVISVRSHRAVVAVYNLTVADLHTYYVLAGDTSVLVHNAGPCKPALGPAYLSDKQWNHIKDGHFPGGKDVTSNEGVFIGSEDLVKNRIYDAIHRGRPMKNTDGRPGHTYTVDFHGYDVGYKINKNGQRVNLQFYTVVVNEGRIVTAYPH